MSKEAVIRFRCSTELKSKLKKLAARKEQVLSDFLRLKVIEAIELEEEKLSQKDKSGKTPNE